jgi:hypothetical protein
MLYGPHRLFTISSLLVILALRISSQPFPAALSSAGSVSSSASGTHRANTIAEDANQAH